MNFKKIIFVIPALIIVLSSCGAEYSNELSLSGKIIVPHELAPEIKGPVFVGVSYTDDVELMRSEPLEQIAVIVPAEDSGFHIDITESGLKPGDNVFIFAFADNDYSGGIPNPTEGDIVGFFVDEESLSTRFTLKQGDSVVTLNTGRRTYDISPEVIGVIEGSDAGEVIIIAYAGDFNSLNFSDLDTDAIIGYKKINKGSAPCSFELKILPYITPAKYSMPILGVYIIALLDRNGNGIPDAGDTIGFPVNGTAGDYPMAMNIQDRVNSCGSIHFRKTISEPADPGNPMKITGTFDAPDDYDGTPMFIVVAKSSDPEEVFTNMVDTVKYFRNVTADYSGSDGVFSFNEDLSSSGLSAGDTVMIIALWDKDFNGGLPEATAGDITGFLQNKGDFAYSVPLNSGINSVSKGSDGDYLFNGAGGYDFSLKRKIYRHSASIKFKLEKGNLSDTEFANGNVVQVIALHDPEGNALADKNIGMDKIIASKRVLIQHDINSTVTSRYSMNVLPAIPLSIQGVNPDDFYIPDIYIAAFLDSNGNGKPDTGEKVAFYYKTVLWVIDTPDKITLYDGANVPGKNIKFSQTY